MTAENNTIRLNTLDLQMEGYMLTQDSSVSLYEAHKLRFCTLGHSSRHSILNGVHPPEILNQYLDRITIKRDSFSQS